MPDTNSVYRIFKENKRWFFAGFAVLMIAEIIFFTVALNHSGRKSWLQVFDEDGAVIYETRGDTLSEFSKYYFEQTFGPFENYPVKLVTKEVPFPVTAWLAAAVGIPAGLILMAAFAVKAWFALFIKEPDAGSNGRQSAGGAETPYEDENFFERAIERINRFNIFTIGFLIVLLVFSLWAVPRFFSAAVNGLGDIILRYKWIFTAVFAGVVLIIIWFIYLKYLLARKSLESRTELSRLRLELELKNGGGSEPLRLAHRESSVADLYIAEDDRDDDSAGSDT